MTSEEIQTRLLEIERRALMHNARLTALCAYTTGKVSRLQVTELPSEIEELEHLVIKAYESMILDIGDVDPERAARLDFRPNLPDAQRKVWEDPEASGEG